MKKLALLLFVLYSFTSQAQEGYVVTTLDSIVTTAANQGVYGLSSVVKDNNIHLAYVYGSAEENYYLVYEVRKNGQQLLKENVLQYPNAPWLGATTAIQFDAFGSPYIYCAQVVGGLSNYITIANKSGGVWGIFEFDYDHRNQWLHSSGALNQELGFVTERIGDQNNDWQHVIDYFHLGSNGWSSFTISASSLQKSRPVAFHHGNEVYVAFAEQRPHSDTVLVHVRKKQNGIWQNELDLSFPQAAPANNHWCKFGLSNGNVHFFHTYDISTFSQPLTHLVKTSGGWEEIPINEGRDEYLFVQWQAGNNIDVDSEGNLFFAARDWVFKLDDNNAYFEYPNPLEGPHYLCYDMAIVDDVIHLYFVAGDKNWPHGDPVMFYEAIGSIAEITAVRPIDNAVIVNYAIAPNPGNGNYVLELDLKHSADLFIQWFDVNGKSLGKIATYKVHEGRNSLRLLNPVNNKGVYFIEIRAENSALSIPVIQQ